MKIKIPRQVEQTEMLELNAKLPLYFTEEAKKPSHIKIYEEQGHVLRMEIWYSIIPTSTLSPPLIDIKSVDQLGNYEAEPLYNFFYGEKTTLKISTEEAFNKALRDAASEFHAFLDFHLGNEQVKGRPTTEPPKPQPHVANS